MADGTRKLGFQVFVSISVDGFFLVHVKLGNLVNV